MKTILETRRLLVREFGEADAEAFHAFNSNPEVMRHTGDTPTESVEHARDLIRAYPDYEKHGYGRWAVVHRATGHVIGFNGLKYLEELEEVDLGYRFLPMHWGRGIATESSLAIVRHGFDSLRLERIIGLVMPENTASIRVLEKVGMSFDETIEYFGSRVQKWSVSERRHPDGVERSGNCE